MGISTNRIMITPITSKSIGIFLEVLFPCFASIDETMKTQVERGFQITIRVHLLIRKIYRIYDSCAS